MTWRACAPSIVEAVASMWCRIARYAKRLKFDDGDPDWGLISAKGRR